MKTAAYCSHRAMEIHVVPTAAAPARVVARCVDCGEPLSEEAELTIPLTRLTIKDLDSPFTAMQIDIESLVRAREELTIVGSYRLVADAALVTLARAEKT